MTTPDKNSMDDPTSRKLPPAREPAPESPRGGWIPTAGVSPKLKIFVIGLTFVTIMAFGIFTALLIKKAFVKGPDNRTWGPQLVIIAEELKNQGLKPQAIEHYQKYLETQEVDLKTRSRVSLDIARLYAELGQCDDAVVWFLHAKTARPSEPGNEKTEIQLQQCQNRSKTRH